MASIALASGAMARNPALAQPAESPVHVLLVYGLEPDRPDVSAFTQQLRDALRRQTPRPIEFYQENLDLDRFPGRDAHLVNYFAGKYGGTTVDVVVPVGALALRFVTEKLRSVLPPVPVVFALTNDSRLEVPIPRDNVTGRLARYPFWAGLEIAESLQPDAERVVIIGGVSHADSIGVRAALRAVAARAHPLPVVLLRDITYESLMQKLAHLPPRTIVLASSFRRDARGQSFASGELSAEIARVSSAPVYGSTYGAVGRGFVAAGVIDPAREGIATSHLITRVLRRTAGEPLPPVVVAPTALVADWRQLERWNLAEERLPPGTRVLYRIPTLWERYRAAMFASLGIIALQAVLIALLLAERQRRRRAQSAIEEQLAYEQTMVDLTTDAARHAPLDTKPALEDALARVGRFAGASRAVLVQFPEGPAQSSSSLSWTSGSGTNVAAPAHAKTNGNGGRGLEIPLIADGAPIGELALYHPDSGFEWTPRLVGRLNAAGELIAGAMARSRAARAVRAGEELNRAVLASLSTQIAILDRDGVIVRVNEAWRVLARRGGVPAHHEAFVGANYLDECRRAEQEGFEEAREVWRGIESVLRRRALSFRCEYHSLAPEIRWCELRVDLLDHEDGGAIVTHIDITDRRLAEVRAEETRRQVAHMGRVAMVGELASTVSHELRQPLAAMRANAEGGAILLERYPERVEEAIQIFRDIVDDDVRAAEIIDRTRMLLRNEPTKSVPVDLNDVCVRAAQMLNRNAMLRHTRVTILLDAVTPTVIGDAVQLQQVVLNLVLNALDAMATSPDERLVTVRTEVGRDEVELSVRDCGPGLAPDAHRHLFEPFYSTKAQGLGMGLVIVRSIVERHRGRVVAENHPEGGAEFRVWLPLV